MDDVNSIIKHTCQDDVHPSVILKDMVEIKLNKYNLYHIIIIPNKKFC